MQVVLLLAGIVAIGAGIATLLASVGNGSFDPGHPLITAGTVSLTSGFLLAGLASVVARLRRIADALDTQPLPRSIVGAAESLKEPTTVQPPAVEVSLAPQQPNGGKEPASIAEAQVSQTAVTTANPDQTDASPEKREPIEKREPTLVAGAPMVPPLATVPREDLAPASPAMEWPRVDAADRAPIVSPRLEPPLPEVSPAPGDDVRSDHRDPAEAQDSLVSNEPAPRVLKSGVIEGMAYTLYSDGSVEAELPQGTRRFDSIGEWRAHMREQT